MKLLIGSRDCHVANFNGRIHVHPLHMGFCVMGVTHSLQLNQTPPASAQNFPQVVRVGETLQDLDYMLHADGRGLQLAVWFTHD